MSKVMIVTGSSRGIGAAIAFAAGRQGYDVCVNYRNAAEDARRVVETIRARGGKAISVQADIGQETDVLRLFETVDHELGRATALVNNAGVLGQLGRVAEIRADDLDRVLSTNIRGTILCSREAVRRMSTSLGGEGGGIVNLCSLAARLGAAGRSVHYAASKGAVEAFTRGLAREVGGEGIRVNAVSPGLIDTESQPREKIVKFTRGVPLQRPGTADEVADAVLWLLSPQASFVSGTIVDVTGGS